MAGKRLCVMAEQENQGSLARRGHPHRAVEGLARDDEERRNEGKRDEETRPQAFCRREPVAAVKSREPGESDEDGKRGERRFDPGEAEHAVDEGKRHEGSGEVGAEEAESDDGAPPLAGAIGLEFARYAELPAKNFLLEKPLGRLD